MISADTIAAVATARGRGAIGIVKLSGAGSVSIAEQITGKKLTPRHAHQLPFYGIDGEMLDQGLAILFSAPDSYTGEHVLELHAHGNSFVLDQLLQTAIHHGARDARPGEFTERAFLNNKLDLAQAEAVADLIESNSAQAARAAVRSLSGDFSARIADLCSQLISTRMYVEAALDFAEEEIDFLKDEALAQRLAQLQATISDILSRSAQGCLMREGLTVVIAGKPNVGKSSLLNRLTGEETAIVTDIAGTTRDVLREQIIIDGLPIHVIDTAGLRKTDDKVEQEGVRRALKQMETADVLLVVETAGQTAITDLGELSVSELPRDVPVIRVFNKADLAPDSKHLESLLVSARTGDGIDALRERLKQCAGFEQTPEGAFMARRRHLNALQAVEVHVIQARANLTDLAAGELAAEELRLAQEQLNIITGEFSSDDLLGEIFGNFCIGK